MAKQTKEDNRNKIAVSSQDLTKKQYHQLNIAFSLMTVIPFLVFFYILCTRLFSINIVIGDIGLAIAVALYLAFLGYLIGFSIVRNLVNRIINYSEEIKLSYHQLNQTHELLVQAEKFKAIGELASGIAHEVKNPLAIILQGVNYLEEYKIAGDDFRGALDAMKKNIERADRIINTLVDFSRISKLNIEPLDINSIIENSLLLVKYRAELGNIKFVNELKANLPKVLVDVIRIEQVFVNIMINAIQAMPKGGTLFIRTYEKKMNEIGFRVGKRKELDFFKPGEIVIVVEIEDTGVGISKENLKVVFDPFFTTKGPKAGVGLGLSVTRNIVEMHRGIITIDSEEGKGTKATLILKTLGG